MYKFQIRALYTIYVQLLLYGDKQQTYTFLEYNFCFKVVYILYFQFVKQSLKSTSRLN